jgi:N-acetylglucosamine repressor
MKSIQLLKIEVGDTVRRTGDLKLMQELNRSIVLDTIRQLGPISRVGIAKKINLSPTTVTSAVSELIHEGLVCEKGIGNSSGGRKPILLRFNPDSHFLIGVSIRTSSITIAEMNLEANIKRKKVYAPIEGQNITSYITNFIEHFMRDTESIDKCIGISIITQGIVDSTNGIIRYNPKLKIKNVNIKDLIEKQFGLPVWLDNDSNAYIIAEKTFGPYNTYQNMLYIEIGEGVGAGIVVNGSIYRGNNGGAGEFGHTSIDRGGIPCECGNIGCLENYVGWSAVYSRIITSLMSGKQSIMSELVNGNITQITQSIYSKAIQYEDQLAVSILDETINYLARGIVNFVHLVNPEVIILGGEVVFDNPIFITKISSHVNEYAFDILSDGLEIKQASLGKEFEMVGAASVLLQDKFQFTLS